MEKFHQEAIDTTPEEQRQVVCATAEARPADDDGDIQEPGDNDYILGRGGLGNKHSLNNRVRELWISYIERYRRAGSSTPLKQEICREALQKAIKAGAERFLKKEKGRWVEVPLEDKEGNFNPALLKKVSQFIRDRKNDVDATASQQPHVPPPGAALQESPALMTGGKLIQEDQNNANRQADEAMAPQPHDPPPPLAAAVQKAPPPPEVVPTAPAAAASTASGLTTRGTQPSNARINNLDLQKSQKLLLKLLGHELRCQHPEGQCPVKRRWAHLSVCRHRQCSCLISRTVLSHYYGCNNESCSMCAPVQAALRDPKIRGQKRKGSPPPQQKESASRPPAKHDVSLLDSLSPEQLQAHVDLLSTEKLIQNDQGCCALCGRLELSLKPPVHCVNCQKPLIRGNQNSYYSAGGSYLYTCWCTPCYNKLDEKMPIELSDKTIRKVDLQKKEHNEAPNESWVQCDTCKGWVHQVCGLFNPRQHFSKYSCPRCLLGRRRNPSSRSPGAADLPWTLLSDRLERKLSVSLAEASLGGPIVIRQVSSMARKLQVSERMKTRYAHKNYLGEFPFRSKCIIVFQELDGVDVILFALYVHEFGEDSPPPNNRVVYISYLDSVNFMRPSSMRTRVYREVLVAYLAYARERGFVSAHIWACPPQKGDDYILHGKPEDQKSQSDEELCAWYRKMLKQCEERDIVESVTNMYDKYFANSQSDATVVPFFENDYFSREVERVLQRPQKNKNRKGQDPVMVKIGKQIQENKLKESLFVVHLKGLVAEEEGAAVSRDTKRARIEYSAAQKFAQMPNTHSARRGGVSGALKVEAGQPTQIIDDDAEDLDCKLLNDRQAFLNLCMRHCFQFDELRRAKHTSMMVLWHLHNKDAPLFVPQCHVCSQEILNGVRYHCSTCPQYDLCLDCYKNPETNRGKCTHELVPIAVPRPPPPGSPPGKCLGRVQLEQETNHELLAAVPEGDARESSQQEPTRSLSASAALEISSLRAQVAALQQKLLKEEKKRKDAEKKTQELKLRGRQAHHAGETPPAALSQDGNSMQLSPARTDYRSER